MSTILQALQKNKLDQTTPIAPMMVDNNQPLRWKVLISFALATIIVLLSILIYLLLNPRQELLNTHSAVTLPVEPRVISQANIEKKTETHNIVKIDFDTQPIAPLVKKPLKAVTNVIATQAPKEASTAQLQEQQSLTALTTQDENVTQKAFQEANQDQDDTQELDYEDISNELKARFEQAVLLSEIEEQQQGSDDLEIAIQEEINDGRDIRQMSTAFQHKVAPIHYDSHMYSSVVEDRWIRINGEVLKEGQFDSTGELELLEIQPQRSIFRVQRQSFSLESLTDWQGY